MTLTEPFGRPPDPATAGSLDELVERLRLLKVWAGDPSYETIKARVNATWRAAGRPAGDLTSKTTIVDCFRSGRRRLNADLVLGMVGALHPDPAYVARWRQTLRTLSRGVQAASQVRIVSELPPDAAGFTGRTEELRRLREALLRGYDDGGTVVVSAIAGMAGVGKTRLAVRAAHGLMRERAVDRVLFVNLHGFHEDPAQPPADPFAVLAAFLDAFGVPAGHIPRHPAQRAAAWRTRLAGTRTLVVLDNAADEDQVLPLLTGTPHCPTLVTSRRDLTGLGADRLAVDVLGKDDAVHLLLAAAGPVPRGEDRDAAARIADRCGRLPLALGLVGGHIRHRSGWTLTDHADRLDELWHDRRLHTVVEAAFDVSYRHLDAQTRRLLRLLALHPGQDHDTYAAAALTGTDPVAARTRLDGLVRDHLLQTSSPNRWTFHDLIRTYAVTRVRDEESPRARRVAMNRLLDHYRAATGTAMDTLFPAEAHARPSVPAPPHMLPAFSTAEPARRWLDEERAALVAACAHAAGNGYPTYALDLSAILFRYLNGGHHTDALVVHGHARIAAERSGDRLGLAHALTNLGTAYGQLARYTEAGEQFAEALELFREADDPGGQIRTLNNLGNVATGLGQYAAAIDYLTRSLKLSRVVGDATSEARALGNLGNVESKLGRYGDAVRHLRQVIDLSRRIGDAPSEGLALSNLGSAEGRLGRATDGVAHLREAVAVFGRIGNRTGAAWALQNLGTVEARRGNQEGAAAAHQEAYDVFRETGDAGGETAARNGLGEAAMGAGRPGDALDHHLEAARIADRIGDRLGRAVALSGLGLARRALGEHEQAHRDLQEALALHEDLGTPEATRIRVQLEELRM